MGKRTKEYLAGRSLYKKYGITLVEYNEMLFSQGGRCKICGIPAGACTSRLHVDHCHRTLKIRGLLCAKCNHMLGASGDRLEVLLAGARYLNESNA